MTCSRSQLLSILMYLEEEIKEARDKEEALKKLERLKERVKVMSIEDVVREFALHT